MKLRFYKLIKKKNGCWGGNQQWCYYKASQLNFGILWSLHYKSMNRITCCTWHLASPIHLAHGKLVFFKYRSDHATTLMEKICSLVITAKQIPRHGIQCLSGLGLMLSFRYFSVHLFLPLLHNICPYSDVLCISVSVIADNTFVPAMYTTIHSSFKTQLKCFLFHDGHPQCFQLQLISIISVLLLFL